MNPLLSVIVPAFNEQGRIPSTLKALQTYLGSQSYDWEIIVVDDGSTDGTAEIVGELAVEGSGVRIEKIPHGGKGSAVRRGMLAAGGAYRFMCDADLAMPIEQLPEFLKRMDDGYDIVIGSREAEGARRFGEPPARHFVGRVFDQLIEAVADLTGEELHALVMEATGLEAQALHSAMAEGSSLASLIEANGGDVADFIAQANAAFQPASLSCQ